MAARFFNTFLGFLWLDMVFDDLVRRHSSVFGETNVIIYSFFVVFFGVLPSLNWIKSDAEESRFLVRQLPKTRNGYRFISVTEFCVASLVFLFTGF